MNARVSLAKLGPISEKMSTAARSVTVDPLDRMPLLIIDRCLASASADLAVHAEALFRGGAEVATETLTMPKRGFGPRPILIMDPSSRTAFQALILESLGPAPEEASDAWDAHQAFGLPDIFEAQHYVVDIDIAACFEYIDHALLRDELILQTSKVDIANTLADLLSAAFGRQRGLPQLSSSSDLLADIYLSAIERSLVRRGFELSRYADDFRLTASSWTHANEVIEVAAELARDWGLALSSDKTRVRRASLLGERESAKDDFIERYFHEARRDNSGTDFWFSGPYSELDEDEDEDEDEDDGDIDEAGARREGFRNLLNDWAANLEADDPDQLLREQLIGKALSFLSASEDSVDDETLFQIAQRHPIRLQSIVQHVLSRGDRDAGWATLGRLVHLDRQSPWTKLWLLHAATDLLDDASDRQAVDAWAKQLRNDRHEVIRAEATWYLACTKLVTPEEIAETFQAGSRISRPSLAAAMGRLNPESKPLVQAIRNESPLTKVAFDWGGTA